MQRSYRRVIYIRRERSYRRVIYIRGVLQTSHLHTRCLTDESSTYEVSYRRVIYIRGVLQTSHLHTRCLTDKSSTSNLPDLSIIRICPITPTFEKIRVVFQGGSSPSRLFIWKPPRKETPVGGQVPTINLSIIRIGPIILGSCAAFLAKFVWGGYDQQAP